MNHLKPQKRVKPSMENQTDALIKNPEIFINQLDNYKKLKNISHVRKIDHIFSQESNLGDIGALQSALILTFLHSLELIESYLSKGVRFVVVSDSQKDTTKTTLEEAADKNLKIIYPQRSFGPNSPSTFHPKLYLLKFKKAIRIVIGSGNLLNCDWNRYANVFWRKDFPLLSPNESETKPNPFVSYLKQFINLCTKPFHDDIDKFLSIDFSKYKIDEGNVHLIASVPFKWLPKSDFDVSFFQAAKTIKAHRPKVPFKLESTRIFYVTSSLGCLCFKLLYDFAKIVFHENSFNWDYAVSRKEELINMYNVIFPSSNYISGSYFGESRANCLFLRRMIYDSFKFQKNIMRAFEGNLSVEGNNSVLPHYKIFLVTHNGVVDDDTIVYIGSHNFTQSAWGKFEKNEEAVEVFNYELGLIWPSKPNSALGKKQMIESFGVNFPPQPYSQHDTPFFVRDN